MPEPLLTTAAAAQRLGITERHLRELIYRKRITYTKIGYRVRFVPADLDEYIESRTIKARAS